jgi:alkylation response protein AidB-like acyl-CoA dehydrogenase
LGDEFLADSGEWGTFAWTDFLLSAPGLRFAGGTDEIMLNILAEGVLGLPREPRGDTR